MELYLPVKIFCRERNIWLVLCVQIDKKARNVIVQKLKMSEMVFELINYIFCPKVERLKVMFCLCSRFGWSSQKTWCSRFGWGS